MHGTFIDAWLLANSIACMTEPFTLEAVLTVLYILSKEPFLMEPPTLYEYLFKY